jgi:hypothetical protein
VRALDKVTVKDPEDAAAAYNPGTFREGIRCLSHPPEQRTPRLLLNGEEKEDVACVDAFVRRALVLWQQIRAQLYKHRRFAQRLRPGTVLDMEGVQIDRAGERPMC